MLLNYSSISDLGHTIIVHKVDKTLDYDLFLIDVPELDIFNTFVEASVINACPLPKNK
jgi:hypothetical protein